MSDLFQSVPFAVVLLIIGFVFLVKGADAFVEGCSSCLLYTSPSPRDA
mgnify:CR=1 FL=1